MNWAQYVIDRMKEPSTWGGVAAFSGSMGAYLATQGMPKLGAILVGASAGFTGLACYLKEGNHA